MQGLTGQWAYEEPGPGAGARVIIPGVPAANNVLFMPILPSVPNCWIATLQKRSTHQPEAALVQRHI